MSKVRFTGEFYRTASFVASAPGVYEVDEQFAAYLVGTHPYWFAHEAPQAPQKESDSKKGGNGKAETKEAKKGAKD